jgi:hypothetical protein
MLSIAVVGLAAQAPPGGARFCVVDGRQAEAPSEGPLARLPGVLPSPVRLGGWRELGPVMTEVAAEVDRRQKEPDADHPPLYLILYGVQRMRDLRRPDDDFSYGRRDEGPTLPQQFATVLREGPSLGVHTLFWCDNVNNLQRCLDRASQREVGLRVVFQMGVADSSNLIDTPAASKLGMHRALFFSEEDGRLEKFRPYGVPPDEWLDKVREQLRPANGQSPTAEAERQAAIG